MWFRIGAPLALGVVLLWGCDGAEQLECPLDPPRGHKDYLPVAEGNTWRYDFEADTTTWYLGVYNRRRQVGTVTWTVGTMEDCVDGQARYTVQETFEGRRETWDYDEQAWVSGDVFREEVLLRARVDSLVSLQGYTGDPIRRYWPFATPDSVQVGSGGRLFILERGKGIVHIFEHNRVLGGFDQTSEMRLQAFTVRS